jgi:hypothetical protein
MKITGLKNWKQYLNFFKKLMSFLLSKMSWVFLAVLAVSIIHLVYIWYFFIFNSSWSEEKKQGYINTHGKEVMLDEKKFDSVINEFSKRKERYNLKSEIVKDIFQ